MSVHLPKAIELFMSSENAQDAGALAECFAPDARVRDEGRTRAGLTEIAAWRRETTEKYHHTVEPAAVAKRGGKTIVVTKLSGDFPGSPIIRKLAAEYFERFPKDRYQTEVESWRELQSQNIEFTMKRLREPIERATEIAK
jgi:hypothetical protein